jgi:thiamine-monophosphate kinase
MGEFDVIRQFFTRPSGAGLGAGPGVGIGPAFEHAGAAQRVVLGVGDDCALLQPAPGMQMAISTDMLVSGRHFFPDVDPQTLGHKALAVNLSDLAACGARPLAFTLALALPQAGPAWLAPFAQGLFALADAHGCALVGGDTTRGPLNICITVFGEVPSVGVGADGGGAVECASGQALLRSGAQVGDDVYVSGTLGDARLALLALQGRLPPGFCLLPPVLAQARLRLEQPTPRVALGMALRSIATAAADVSDGLMGDLGHILAQSGAGNAKGLGATLNTALAMQLMAARAQCPWETAEFDSKAADALALQCVLNGGDDYELVFTAPPSARAAVLAASASSATPVARIGTIEALPGVRLVDGNGAPVHNSFASFDHFA